MGFNKWGLTIIINFATIIQYDYMPMKKFLYNLKLFLESIDSLRDRFLYPLIKSYWPCQITPNHLTYTRFIIGAWLLILLFGFKNNNHTLIVTLFFVGIITDFLDGPIARCLKMETDWGGNNRSLSR